MPLKPLLEAVWERAQFHWTRYLVQFRRSWPQGGGPEQYDWLSWGIGSWLGLVVCYGVQLAAADAFNQPMGFAPMAVIPGLVTACALARPLNGKASAVLRQMTGMAKQLIGFGIDLAIAAFFLTPAIALLLKSAVTAETMVSVMLLAAAVEVSFFAIAIAAGIWTTVQLRTIAR